MKISKVETVVVGSQSPGTGRMADRNFIFVRVHTDGGLIGLGEATLEGHTSAVLGMLADLEALVVDEDPRQVVRLTQVMMRQKFWQGGVIKGSAVAGIELALWDILGKSLGVPVHQLVGGACRDRIRYYQNGWWGKTVAPEGYAERAAANVEQGHRALKFSLPLASWPMYDRELVGTIEAIATAIRDVVGPDVMLMFDGHGRYDPDLSLLIARVLEDHDFAFFEEPVQPHRVDDTARVARGSRIPIAAGERLERKEQFHEFLKADAVSVVQPDLAHCHGFGEALQIASLADTYSRWLAPHGPMSPVLTAISTHLDAVAPNFLIQERLEMAPWCQELITEPLVMADGFLEVPHGPGWGVELDLDVCAAHPAFTSELPRLFREDGSISDW